MGTRKVGEGPKEIVRKLMAIPGVVGVGEGLFEKKPCLKVFVVKRTPEIEQKIPKTFGDYPVLIEETGEVRALPGSRG